MSVHILNEEPVYVIPGSSLDLKAQIKRGHLEDISTITWEHEPETGFNIERATLATCSGRSLKCAGTRPNVRVSTEQQETTLQINGYTTADSGVYTLTVTDRQGANTSTQCIVREYGTV